MNSVTIQKPTQSTVSNYQSMISHTQAGHPQASASLSAPSANHIHGKDSKLNNF